MAHNGRSGLSKQEVLDTILDRILYLELKPGESMMKMERTPTRFIYISSEERASRTM